MTEAKEIKTLKGAFDKDGTWWHESDIRVFSRGVIEMCFGTTKEKIKIIEVPEKGIRRFGNHPGKSYKR